MGFSDGAAGTHIEPFGAGQTRTGRVIPGTMRPKAAHNPTDFPNSPYFPLDEPDTT